MTPADHQRLADVLNATPARWMLTYDNEPAVRDLYPDRRVVAYEIPNSANRARLAVEYAVFSDDVSLPADLMLLPRSAGTLIDRAGATDCGAPAELLGSAA
ncbi:hypothetical protein ET495_15060 [Xylanimonas allomyrinae]|uniref:Uncharacterized protein n=1 Tax=Xylanimonas allomyrinae TaxID=2509459 RepID=A0A4P6EPE3_9MICO|nr:hypothetical protein [Xylanimonas allomyrinae]QAY64305.1 hypothetical protein ET495_15060 [Xylanimonas allomyrinae]